MRETSCRKCGELVGIITSTMGEEVRVDLASETRWVIINGGWCCVATHKKHDCGGGDVDK